MSLPALLGWIFRFVFAAGVAFLVNHFLPPESWSWRVQDLIYRRMPPSPPDTQIVVIDIARMGRGQLAQLLRAVGEAQPRFIGIDAIFPTLISPREDTLWAQALCTVSARVPVCLASTLDLSKGLERAPERPASHENFTQCAEQAFANVILHDSAARIARECLLYTIADGDTALSLGTRTALALDSSLRDTLFALPPRMLLRYQGGMTHFYLLTGEDIIRDSIPLAWLRGKVVLLGVADPLRQTMEDIFFSPFNEGFLRRSFPDLYGIFIHANVASMLMHRSFFHEVSYLWVGGLLLLAYAFISIAGSGAPLGIWRGVSIRGMQLALLWGAIELTLRLGVKGYWLPVEPLLWFILIAGEMEIWRLPYRIRLA